jgi:hypothetical protein
LTYANVPSDARPLTLSLYPAFVAVRGRVHVVAFYALGADFIAVFHFLYVLFAVGGQVSIVLGVVLGWEWVRNPAFRIIHLAAVSLVAVEAMAGMFCPLTIWEYDLRTLAGQATETNLSFIARLMRMIIYYDFPPWVFTVIHISFGLLVILTFVLMPPRFRKRDGRSHVNLYKGKNGSCDRRLPPGE